jgi:hypothetical protein
MQKLRKRLVVALSTFVLGLSISYLVQLRRDSAIYRAVEIPEFCEVHGERLSTVGLEFVCGEFRNSRGDYLKAPCVNGSNPKLSAQDALLFFHLSGGLSTLEIWHILEVERQSSFPHAYGDFFRQCSADAPNCKSRKVCVKCRAAELAWMKQHSEYLSR